MSNELDDLLKELKQNNEIAPPPPKPKTTTNISEDNISDYIMQNASKLIETGLDSVQTMRDVVSQTYGAEEVEAYAALIKSVTDSIETLNKIHIQNKKTKAAKELKQMDIDSKQQLGPAIHTTNNVLIATRDEIIKGLIQAASAQPIQPLKESDDKTIEIKD